MLGNPPVALKEWAAALKALERGEQILIMRKGGIAEETKHFQLRQDRFYLFPTYEHQKIHLLKTDAVPLLEETLLEAPKPDEPVRVSLWAEAVEDLPVRDAGQLAKLHPFHIWTERFAEERLRWKKLQPLHVILLRVYKLPEPAAFPLLPEYAGCKSWVELQGGNLLEADGVPVLTDGQFAQARREIRTALGLD